jgi:hypothetical protein
MICLKNLCVNSIASASLLCKYEDANLRRSLKTKISATQSRLDTTTQGLQSKKLMELKNQQRVVKWG